MLCKKKIVIYSQSRYFSSTWSAWDIPLTTTFIQYEGAIHEYIFIVTMNSLRYEVDK